jgi:hypothetical protein
MFEAFMTTECNKVFLVFSGDSQACMKLNSIIQRLSASIFRADLYPQLAVADPVFLSTSEPPAGTKLTAGLILEPSHKHTPTNQGSVDQ